ncbi:MAG TPA: hypothetical protein VE053_12575 [Allosphingosinicella sp.]|nr:hypothetical protein [Allosphingosinicella sp.]
MNRTLQTSSVAIAGLITSIATAVGNTFLHWLTGFNLFTLSFLIVLPAGALLCGFAAASGYYFGAKFFHIRPTKILLVQMVVIAAVTQLLIYWLEYQVLYIDGVHVADIVPFGHYLDIVLTTQHISLGRTGVDAGQVGEGGYWLAALDLIGFLIGGACVYFWLLKEPTCESCNKYLRTVAKKRDSFDDQQAFAAYYDGEFQHPVDSSEFARHVGHEHSAGKAVAGTINMETRLLECPSCGDQTVVETVQVFNGSDWNEVDELKRLVPMPNGVDVRRAYSGTGPGT